jgi:hypothetical protein
MTVRVAALHRSILFAAFNAAVVSCVRLFVMCIVEIGSDGETVKPSRRRRVSRGTTKTVTITASNTHIMVTSLSRQVLPRV